MAAQVSIDKLLRYLPAPFPSRSLIGTASQASEDNGSYFTDELRSIRAVLNAIVDVLQSGMTGVTVKTGAPSATDLSKGSAGVFKDTGGQVCLAYNDNGTIKKVQLT